MSEIIKEYGSMIIAASSTIMFFGLVGTIFFSNNGLLCLLITAWGNGGY